MVRGIEASPRVLAFLDFDLSGELPEHLAGFPVSVMFEVSGLDEEGQLEFALGGWEAVGETAVRSRSNRWSMAGDRGVSGKGLA